MDNTEKGAESHTAEYLQNMALKDIRKIESKFQVCHYIIWMFSSHVEFMGKSNFETHKGNKICTI